MLQELNKVWRDRERRQIARVKSNCNTELASMKRQITMRAPISENSQSKQIQRLKDQLRSAKKDLRNNVAHKREDKNKPQSTSHIEDALKFAGDY